MSFYDGEEQFTLNEIAALAAGIDPISIGIKYTKVRALGNAYKVECIPVYTWDNTVTNPQRYDFIRYTKYFEKKISGGELSSTNCNNDGKKVFERTHITALLINHKKHDAFFNPKPEADAPEATKDECWDILNPDGVYFPVELAALIRAWREVTALGNKYIEQNMTPKQSIAACLRDNAEIWQLVDEGEILPTRKSEDLAAVASWSDKPGRPKVN